MKNNVDKYNHNIRANWHGRGAWDLARCDWPNSLTSSWIQAARGENITYFETLINPMHINKHFFIPNFNSILYTTSSLMQQLKRFFLAWRLEKIALSELSKERIK